MSGIVKLGTSIALFDLTKSAALSFHFVELFSELGTLNFSKRNLWLLSHMYSGNIDFVVSAFCMCTKCSITLIETFLPISPIYVGLSNKIWFYSVFLVISWKRQTRFWSCDNSSEIFRKFKNWGIFIYTRNLFFVFFLWNGVIRILTIRKGTL